MLLADMQNSQPHMKLYWELIFLSCYGRILNKIESLMIILLSASLDFFSPHYSGWIEILLGSSCTKTCYNNFGINLFCSYHKWKHKGNNFLLEIAQSEDGVESNCKYIIWPFDIFCMNMVLYNVWP